MKLDKVYVWLALCSIVLFSIALLADETTEEDWTRFEVMQCSDASEIEIPPIAIYQDDMTGDNVVLITWESGCEIFINGYCCSESYRSRDEFGRPIFYGEDGLIGLICQWMIDCDGEGGRMEEVQLGFSHLASTRTIFPNGANTLTRGRRCACESQEVIHYCISSDCDNARTCNGGGTTTLVCVWKKRTLP